MLPKPVPNQNGDRGGADRKPLVGGTANLAFKSYVIVTMTILWTGYTISLRFTRTAKDRPLYFSTTVVLLAETVKFFLAGTLLWRQHQWNFAAARAEFRNEFLNKPRELLKMSVPSIVYAIQNNLDFVALSNLDPGVYQVTIQLKVVTTALFMVAMLGRRFSLTRWIAIVLLFSGVALVQLDAQKQQEIAKASQMNENSQSAISSSKLEQNYLVGIIAVLITCVTAGFAGVYFEKMLKDSETSLWIRNLQMYFCGMISAAIGCALNDGAKIMEFGFFYGYYDLVWLIVGFLSAGGIYISMVMKYLDNLLKSFASAVSISLVSVLSLYIFGTSLGGFFLLGTIIVCGSIMLYNYVPE